MEQKRNVEFRTPSGTVSPFVLDNFTRYALPELAEDLGPFVVENDKAAVQLGVIKGTAGQGNQYVVGLHEVAYGPQPATEGDDSLKIQKVFHFPGNNIVQTYQLESAKPVLPGIQERQTIAGLADSSTVSRAMNRQDLATITSAWLKSEVLNGKAQGILQQLCTEQYGLVDLDDAASADEYPLRHAQFIMGSAVQILAADPAAHNGKRQRETRVDLDDRTTRQDVCTLEVSVSDNGMAVKTELASSTSRLCDEAGISPAELDRASAAFHDQYDQFETRQQCRERLQAASRLGMLCRQKQVLYRFGYVDGTLERRFKESLVIAGDIVAPKPQVVAFDITMRETDDYFMNNERAAAPFGFSEEFGGYLVPYSQNIVSQYHLEEMTAILGRLQLLLRPTRWG